MREREGEGAGLRREERERKSVEGNKIFRVPRRSHN
jgi:hypothetical protein